ncbi:MAG: hypothetical protein LBL93_03825 [Ruminococcus sp.]|jgi:cell division septum initiation protein DivIVA|nr:hypothetical protein [Ruminococcus sp.]
MDGQVYLKETKGMTKGFDKQGVLSYIDAKDKEIATLKKTIRELEETPITSADVDVAKYEKEIESLKDERIRLNQQLGKMEEQLAEAIDNQSANSTPIDEAKYKAIESKNIELSQKLIELSGKDAELGSEIKRLRSEISQLKSENEELKIKSENSGGFAPQYDMSGIFAQAQATAVEITKKAQEAADNMIRDAKSQADIMISEAEEDVLRIKNNASQAAELSAEEVAVGEKSAQEIAAQKELADQLINKVRMAQLETQRVIKEATGKLLEINDQLVSGDLLDFDDDDEGEVNSVTTGSPLAPPPIPQVSAPMPNSYVSAPPPSAPPPMPKPAPKVNFGLNMDDLLKSIEANPDDIGDIPLSVNEVEAES